MHTQNLQTLDLSTAEEITIDTRHKTNLSVFLFCSVFLLVAREDHHIFYIVQSDKYNIFNGKWHQIALKWIKQQGSI